MSEHTETDWAAYYREEDTPWDCGEPHPELVARFRVRDGEKRGFVAGCGFAHDAWLLGDRGLYVLGLDYVEALAEPASKRLAECGGEFLVTDVFQWQPEELFDVAFEHTFFCAIEPEQRPQWGAMMKRALRPGGRLCALAYPIGKPAENGGPPHGYSPTDLQSALGSDFECTLDEPVKHTLDRRDWEERWVEFVRLR